VTKMAPIGLLKFPVSSPADDTPLKKLKEQGYDICDIIGVVGKTEGMRYEFLLGDTTCIC
jgi:hypothetical protein